MSQNWRYAKNGAADPDGAILEIFYVEIRNQHSNYYRNSHDNKGFCRNNAYPGDPNVGGLCRINSFKSFVKQSLDILCNAELLIVVVNTFVPSTNIWKIKNNFSYKMKP